MSETFDHPISEDVAPDLDLPQAEPLGDTDLQPGDYVPDIQVHLPPLLEDAPADHPLTPAEAGAAVGDDATTPPPPHGPIDGQPLAPPPPPPPADPAEAGQSPVGAPLPAHPLTPAEAGAAVGGDTTTPPPAPEPIDGELPAPPPLPTNLDPSEAGQSPIAGPIPNPGNAEAGDPESGGPTDQPPTPDELPPGDTTDEAAETPLGAVAPVGEVALDDNQANALAQAFGADSESFVFVGAPTVAGVLEALGLTPAGTTATSPAATLLTASPNHPVFVVDNDGPAPGRVYHVERVVGPDVTLAPLTSGLSPQTLPLAQLQAAAATAEDFSSGPSPLLVFGATALGVSAVGLAGGFLYQRMSRP